MAVRRTRVDSGVTAVSHTRVDSGVTAVKGLRVNTHKLDLKQSRCLWLSNWLHLEILWLTLHAQCQCIVRIDRY